MQMCVFANMQIVSVINILISVKLHKRKYADVIDYIRVNSAL